MLKQSYHLRKGIAMIELIFAIIIIGISIMSIPQLVSTASKSGYTSLQQESIAQVASDISLILTREWDEAGTNESDYAPMLDTNGNSGLSARNGARSRSFYTSTGDRRSSTTVLIDEGDADDIDDLGANKLTTVKAVGIDVLDQNISVAVSVVYTKDDPTGSAWDTSNVVSYLNPFTSTAPVGTTNIKKIKAVLTSASGVDELEKEITLNAFSCNIGSFRLNRKELP